jgi:putative ABC transport system permease protein
VNDGVSFLTIVLRNALRRPLRSILTALAIAIAVGAVVSLVGVASGFERSFGELYHELEVDLVVVRAGGRQRLTSTLDEAMGPKISALPGVKDIITGLADVVSFEDQGLYGVLVQGWVPETRAFDHIQVVTGRTLRKDDRKAVLLGQILAKNLGKAVGDSLPIFEDEEFRVVGIYKSEGANVFEDGAMVMPLVQLQRLMDRPGQVTGFNIILDKPSDEAAVERVRRRVELLAPGLHVMTTAEHVRSLTEIQMAKAMSWLTSAVALLIGAFGITNTMIMSVHERTREIGILRAVGWRRGRVVRLVLVESIAISVVGALLGSLGAWILVRVLTHVPTVSGLISGRIPAVVFGYGVGVAVIVGLLGGLLPAYRAATLLPTAALRYE